VASHGIFLFPSQDIPQSKSVPATHPPPGSMQIPGVFIIVIIIYGHLLNIITMQWGEDVDELWLHPVPVPNMCVRLYGKTYLILNLQHPVR
jgi:hypothetical protein